MKYNHFSMLPERAFQPRSGRFGMTLEGGGGGGPSSTTTYTQNIPEYLKPQTEALIGGATQEYFTTKPGPDGTYQVTGIKPFTPYSTNVQDYIAGFSPLQRQTQYEAAGMQRPGQFGYGTQLTGAAGAGALDTTGRAYGFGTQGLEFGRTGAAIGRGALDYGETAANLGASQFGAGAGQRYAQMATDPRAMQSYMSPYMQNVVDTQKQAAIRDYQENIMPQIQAQATRAGAFGGSRDAVQRAMAQRNLTSQLQGIQATGTQKAFEEAQRAQQFGADIGMRGIQTGIAGQQAGMQGIQGALAGTEQGMRGAQVGLQGVQAAQAGYSMAGQMGRTLADIGTAQQAADISRMDLQSRLGAAQQTREQALIDQAIKNYQMAREYPYEQLSRYSGLLRGYYTPTTTATTYQAYNPAAQLVGTAAQAYGTYKGLAGKEGGQVKAYAKGGILDAKVFNNPTSFSPEMIKKGIQNDSISEMIGAIGLSQIAEARKQAQQNQALSKPAPEGTVLSDLQQQAMGIEAAPTQLPATLAGGGIIAFAGEDGSLVEEEEMAEPVSIADYMKLSQKYLRKPKTKEETEYEESLRKRPEELAKQRQMDRYMALARFGAAMSRAKTPSFLGAVAEGTEATLPQIAAGEKAYREGVAGAGKELAGLGAKGRAEEIESAKAGFDLYGRAKQREASKSNLKEYAENYVAEKVAAGDKRDPKAIWNEGATKYAMITAAPRYEAAATQRFGQEQDIFKDIGTERDSKIYRENARLAQIPIKPGMDPDLKKRIEDSKTWIANKEAEFERRVAQVRGGGAAPAAKPKASDQVTIGGKTYTKPANMTDAQWAKYKRDMGVQ